MKRIPAVLVPVLAVAALVAAVACADTSPTAPARVPTRPHPTCLPPSPIVPQDTTCRNGGAGSGGN